MKRKLFIIVLVLTLTTLMSGAISYGANKVKVYDPQINPADFSTSIDNKYFTLTPGITFSYETKTEDGIETNKTVVTNLVREVMGVKTLVIWDRVWLNDQLIEETYDWYAQHKNGDVWYFGEESREYNNGKASSTHGSWESGINGALPGIIMKGNPQVGDDYRQEYYKGEAEDKATVLALNEKVTTPYGTFDNCLKTHDYSAIDQTIKEHKYFCPKVGNNVLTADTLTINRDQLVGVSSDANTVSQAQADGDTSGDLAWVLSGIIGLLLGMAIGKFMTKPPTQPSASTEEKSV